MSVKYTILDDGANLATPASYLPRRVRRRHVYPAVDQDDRLATDPEALAGYASICRLHVNCLSDRLHPANMRAADGAQAADALTAASGWLVVAAGADTAATYPCAAAARASLARRDGISFHRLHQHGHE
eukprot:scaffold3311_cov411-Prasinococcus_capsulatus_cf.AAC.4